MGSFIRDGHSTIYDPVRDQLVLHGGTGPNSRDFTGYSLSDTWRLVWGGALDVQETIVSSAAIGAPYPNPAWDHVSLRLELPRTAPVDLSVYDLAGRLVRKLDAGSMAAGRHVLTWDARDTRGYRVRAGIYFVRIRTASATFQRAVVLVR